MDMRYIDVYAGGFIAVIFLVDLGGHLLHADGKCDWSDHVVEVQGVGGTELGSGPVVVYHSHHSLLDFQSDHQHQQ